MGSRPADHRSVRRRNPALVPGRALSGTESALRLVVPDFGPIGWHSSGRDAPVARIAETGYRARLARSRLESGRLGWQAVLEHEDVRGRSCVDARGVRYPVAHGERRPGCLFASPGEAVEALRRWYQSEIGLPYRERGSIDAVSVARELRGQPLDVIVREAGRRMGRWSAFMQHIRHPTDAVNGDRYSERLSLVLSYRANDFETEVLFRIAPRVAADSRLARDLGDAYMGGLLSGALGWVKEQIREGRAATARANPEARPAGRARRGTR
jgi:hypothetical protein